MAGAHFYRRLIERTRVGHDSQHVPVVLVSDPTIPSRLDHLLNHGPSPALALVRLGQFLEAAGASVIAIPSSTAHAYHQQIQEGVRVPVLNLLSETAQALIARGYRRPALLATTATAILELYSPYLVPQTSPIYPDAASQSEIQELVEMLKSGGEPGRLSDRLQQVASRAWAQGADSIVMACTELCLLDIHELKRPVISTTDVLADAILRTGVVYHPEPGHEPD